MARTNGSYSVNCLACPPGDAHLTTLTRFEYDGMVLLQLLEPKGIWARNDGHIMVGTSELVRECASGRQTGPTSLWIRIPLVFSLAHLIKKRPRR